MCRPHRTRCLNPVRLESGAVERRRPRTGGQKEGVRTTGDRTDEASTRDQPNPSSYSPPLNRHMAARTSAPPIVAAGSPTRGYLHRRREGRKSCAICFRGLARVPQLEDVSPPLPPSPLPLRSPTAVRGHAILPAADRLRASASTRDTLAESCSLHRAVRLPRR